MTEERTFLMGKFPAVLPGHLLYARNHMWCRAEGRCCRFGFTSYAVRLMQDVYFLEWHLSAGDAVEFLQEIGHIETSKAVSDLFAPLAGTILRFNGELSKDPSSINVEGYGGGWLFELDADPLTPTPLPPGERGSKIATPLPPGERGRGEGALMDVDQYHQFLESNWEKTQRHIKGKINTED